MPTSSPASWSMAMGAGAGAVAGLVGTVGRPHAISGCR